MRVVSLACSNTEIVSALGRAGLLVGVDDHSDYPHDVVSRLPRVGPDLEIDETKVAALRPDLVLASLTVPGHERVIERIAAAGLPHLVLSPRSLDDVLRDVRTIGDAIGAAEEAADLVASLASSLQPLPAPETRPRVLVQWWPRPVIAPGSESWVDGLLELAGGVNPLAGEACESRPLTDAEVLELAPDAFVLSWCGIAPETLRPEVVLRNPAWQRLEAVRRRRVSCIPEALLGRPGPRLVDGLAALRQVVLDTAADARTCPEDR